MNLTATWETWVCSLAWEDPLEKGMTTQTSILAWRSPWTEEPGIRVYSREEGGRSLLATVWWTPSAPNRDPSVICTRCDSHLGNEEPGAWISMEALIVRGRSILREKKKFSPGWLKNAG